MKARSAAPLTLLLLAAGILAAPFPATAGEGGLQELRLPPLLVEQESLFEADIRMTWISHFYEGMKFPEFNQTTVKKVRKYMRQTYENRGKVSQRTKRLQNLALNEYTWDNTVNRVHKRIKEIYEEAIS